MADLFPLVKCDFCPRRFQTAEGRDGHRASAHLGARLAIPSILAPWRRA